LTSKSYVDNLVSSSTGSTITQADLDTKQDIINDGDLSFARMAGLQAAINSQDKLASKIYLDTQLNKKQNTLLAGTNITISGNTISSTGGAITQADLDTKQNILTSSSNILTNRIDVSDKVVITGAGPGLYLKDTDHRSGMVYMNSNKMYFLSGVANSETWTQVNGQWPLYLQTDTNDAYFGRNINLNTGSIVSSKFKVTQAVTNLTNRFGEGGANEVTIANNVGCSGGTMIFHVSCGGYATLGGLKTYTFRYKDAVGNTRATISEAFLFNQTGVHHAWSRSQRFTGIPANNMLISVQRNDDSLRHDAHDFFTIVMEESPF
jgi:hypothetical protein